MSNDIRLLTESEKEFILDFCAKKENLPPVAKHPLDTQYKEKYVP